MLKTKKIIISLCFSIIAYSAFADERITFEDGIGRQIQLKKIAQKVVILYNYVEYAAVAGDECYKRVVGIGKKAWHNWRKGIWDEFASVCPEITQIADVGLLRFGDFYLEKLISLQPDVLILPKWQYESIDQTLKSHFEKANITLVVTDYANQKLESHVKSTLAIGHTIGKLERAKEVCDYYKTKF